MASRSGTARLLMSLDRKIFASSDDSTTHRRVSIRKCYHRKVFCDRYASIIRLNWRQVTCLNDAKPPFVFGGTIRKVDIVLGDDGLSEADRQDINELNAKVARSKE
jgi:hypothetical protein